MSKLESKSMRKIWKKNDSRNTTTNYSAKLCHLLSCFFFPPYASVVCLGFGSFTSAEFTVCSRAKFDDRVSLGSTFFLFLVLHVYSDFSSFLEALRFDVPLVERKNTMRTNEEAKRRAYCRFFTTQFVQCTMSCRIRN